MGNVILLGVLAVVVLALLLLQRHARRVEPAAPAPVAMAIAEPAPTPLPVMQPQPALVALPVAETPKLCKKKRTRTMPAVVAPEPMSRGIMDVLAMLRNPQTQAAAVVLREVLDAPLSKRRRK